MLYVSNFRKHRLVLLIGHSYACLLLHIFMWYLLLQIKTYAAYRTTILGKFSVS